MRSVCSVVTITRAQLRALQLTLAQAGYTEAQLEAAWREHAQQDTAAGLLGFIRNSAVIFVGLCHH